MLNLSPKALDTAPQLSSQCGPPESAEEINRGARLCCSAVQICSGGVCACKAGFTACAARGGRCLDAQSCPGGGSSSGSASDLNTQGSGGQADNDLLMG